MAERNNIWEDNSTSTTSILGNDVSLYVDKQCIMCPLCNEHAPEHFRVSAQGDHYVCFQQPANATELTRCQTLMAACPTYSIGNRAEPV